VLLKHESDVQKARRSLLRQQGTDFDDQRRRGGSQRRNPWN